MAEQSPSCVVIKQVSSGAYPCAHGLVAVSGQFFHKEDDFRLITVQSAGDVDLLLNSLRIYTQGALLLLLGCGVL